MFSVLSRTSLPNILVSTKSFSVVYKRTIQSTYRHRIRSYCRRNLLLINSFTSGGCLALGDLVQQEIEYRRKILPTRYDWIRIWRMFIVGVTIGPLHHYYYLYLDVVLPKTSVKTVLKKILCDQLIASPLTILFFFYGMGFLEHKPINSCTEEVINKFKYVYLGDLAFWPPVQFLNFYYLPTEYRVIYINAATVVFDVFLSYMKHYDQKH